MKKYIVVWLMILALCLSGCAANTEETPETPAGDTATTNEISCMTFNVLSYNTGDCRGNIHVETRSHG